MKFLSLFSGIEAASVAWLPLGWTCVGFAEIEPFPCAVLKHRYPDVPNLGDVEKITRKQIEALGHIDVVIGGFPCQDLSIAGKRKGLKHADGTNTRSGLFYIASKIAQWSKARYTVIENVPGLFSSHEGRDFASVVGELAGVEFGVPREGWRTTGVALGSRGLVEWTVLDAQWFGLAQRRKRVFLVRDSSTHWRNRPPILLERESLCGNPAPCEEKRERIAPTISNRAKGGGGLGTDAECDGAHMGGGRTDKTPIREELSRCLNAGGMGRLDYETETLIPAGGFFNYAVRRLTPVECCRLQGFPDDYLDIMFNGKPACDGPKYRALGNSMAVPVIRWIGERIQMMEQFK